MRKWQEIQERARDMHSQLMKGGKRCVKCLLPRPCRHHERELYRSELSETALEQELERDEKR